MGGNSPTSFLQAAGGAGDLADTNFTFYSAPTWDGVYAGAGAAGRLKQFNILDAFTVIKGKHALQIGSDFLAKYPQVTGANGAILVAGENNIQNLFTGVAEYLQYQTVNSKAHVHLTNLSVYASDTWRAHQDFTLDYGVRWEFNPPPSAGSPGLPQLVGSLNDLRDISVVLATHGVYRTVYSNVAPRVGIAATIHKSQGRMTIARGGVGIFFDTGSAASAVTAGQFGQYPYYNVTTSTGNIPYSASLWAPLHSEAPTTLPQQALTVTSSNLRSPRTYQWSVTIDQEISSAFMVSASYIGNRGAELIKSAEYSNAVQPYVVPLNIIKVGGDLAVVTNGEASNYQALQLQLRSRIKQRVEALASYTYAHAIDTGSSDFDSVGYAQSNYRADSDNDIRHIFSALVAYMPEGLRQTPFLRALTDGWKLSTIAQLQGAAPFSVPSLDTNRNLYNGLADAIPGVPTVIYEANDPMTHRGVPGGKRLNPAAFLSNPGDRDGTSARNGYRLFGLAQWDLAVSRSWKAWDGGNLNFRVDAFNIPNRANFSEPNIVIGAATFGEAQGTYATTFWGQNPGGSLNTVFSNGGPRSLQLSLKLKF